MIYMGEVTPDLALYAQTLEKDWFKVSDITIDRTAEKYNLVDIPLGDDCADQPWVLLSFDGYFDPEDYQVGFISEYTVINSLETDLGVYSLTGESPVIGQPECFSATVYNPGRNDASITAATFEIEQDGRIIASGNATLPVAPVEPLSMYDFLWDFTPEPQMLGQATLNFRIDVEGDGDQTNNLMSLPIVIKSGGKVMVHDLAATERHQAWF